MGEQIASAVVPSLISGIMGSDEPSYQQPSMDQIMTPLQKELTPMLLDQAKRADQYAKLFENQLGSNQAYFNQQKANYASGSPTTTAPKATATTTTTPEVPATTFSPNEQLDDATKYMDAMKDQRGAGSMGGDPRNQALLRNAVPGSDNPYGKAAFAMSQKTITPEMIEAYRRQKQAADDAAMMAKFKGQVK